jgi:hypothetical protein
MSAPVKASKHAAGPEPQDPVFTAIERHRQAWEAFGEAAKRADTIQAGRDGRTVTPDEESAYHASSEFEAGARKAFLRTLPSTEAGIVAGLKHAAQIDKNYGSKSRLRKFAKTLRESPMIAAKECV